MNETALNLENLKQLDLGKISVAFDVELQRVVKDCMDRPGDKKCRKVAIIFLLSPTDESTGTGDANDVLHVGCEITSAVPKRRTRVYAMRPRVNGALTFHPDSPSDPSANMLYDHVDQETGEIK